MRCGAVCDFDSQEASCVVQGMSLMDFFYLRDWILGAGVGDPRENNTLLLSARQAALTELRTEADLAWLKQDLDRVSDEPVVYLGESS